MALFQSGNKRSFFFLRLNFTYLICLSYNYAGQPAVSSFEAFYANQEYHSVVDFPLREISYMQHLLPKNITGEQDFYPVAAPFSQHIIKIKSQKYRLPADKNERGDLQYLIKPTPTNKGKLTTISTQSHGNGLSGSSSFPSSLLTPRCSFCQELSGVPVSFSNGFPDTETTYMKSIKETSALKFTGRQAGTTSAVSTVASPQTTIQALGTKSIDLTQAEPSATPVLKQTDMLSIFNRWKRHGGVEFNLDTQWTRIDFPSLSSESDKSTEKKTPGQKEQKAKIDGAGRKATYGEMAGRPPHVAESEAVGSASGSSLAPEKISEHHEQQTQTDDVGRKPTYGEIARLPPVANTKNAARKTEKTVSSATNQQLPESGESLTATVLRLKKQHDYETIVKTIKDKPKHSIPLAALITYAEVLLSTCAYKEFVDEIKFLLSIPLTSGYVKDIHVQALLLESKYVKRMTKTSCKKGLKNIYETYQSHQVNNPYLKHKILQALIELDVDDEISYPDYKGYRREAVELQRSGQVAFVYLPIRNEDDYEEEKRRIESYNKGVLLRTRLVMLDKNMALVFWDKGDVKQSLKYLSGIVEDSYLYLQNAHHYEDESEDEDEDEDEGEDEGEGYRGKIYGLLSTIESTVTVYAGKLLFQKQYAKALEVVKGWKTNIIENEKFPLYRPRAPSCITYCSVYLHNNEAGEAMEMLGFLNEKTLIHRVARARIHLQVQYYYKTFYKDIEDEIFKLFNEYPHNYNVISLHVHYWLYRVIAAFNKQELGAEMLLIKAKEASDYFIKVRPNKSTAYSLRGHLAQIEGDFLEAKKYFQKSKSLNPAKPWVSSEDGERFGDDVHAAAAKRAELLGQELSLK